jgi:hypothetical protein
MKRCVCLATLALALIGGNRGLRAEPPCCEPPQESFLKRLGPVGGWCPYGGGLLHWWDPHWISHCGAPDDYCRKPLPTVCWPAYPPYYIWGPPEICFPQSECPRNCHNPHGQPCKAN